MGQKNICHEGIVREIKGEKVFVSITQAAACDKCQAKSMCTYVSSREKIIETYSSDNFQLGDRAVIEMQERHGWLAVFYTFVLPFICVATVFFGLNYFTGKEILSAVTSLAVLIPYYFILFLFRDKISREFVFRSIKPG